MNSKTSKLLQEYFLSWCNDFLTVERFAEYYGIGSIDEAKRLIELGRISHENIVKDSKK